jgi:hypothetical protein
MPNGVTTVVYTFNSCISILLHFSIKSMLTYKKLHATKINNMSLEVPLTKI